MNTKLKNHRTYMKVFCISDPLEAEKFEEMNNDPRFKLTRLETNWDMAGRFRIVFMVTEFEQIKTDEVDE